MQINKYGLFLKNLKHLLSNVMTGTVGIQR